MHSEDDQIVPYQASGPLSAKLLKNGTLKTYKDLPHGMITTHAELINADLLAFIKGIVKPKFEKQTHMNNKMKIVVIGGTGLIRIKGRKHSSPTWS
jgi:hypothetical protein